jgi:aspartyl-tRNA synthetase
MHRTHTCGELRGKHDKENVTLSGWVHSRRDHGGIIFIDLRDRYGVTQVVFDPKHNKESHSLAERLGREFVLKVTGYVRPRMEGMINAKMDTGEIEVLVDKAEILNFSETPPLEITDKVNVNEDFRLKYRYIDLRRQSMQNNIISRHKIIKLIRDYFDKHGFLDIETPILARSTPEGARDYLVPSRVHPGSFFALPQSPQIFKQLLMVSGFDRYMQVARCFRDEDLRADRQPEFTQIDVEMSFVEQEDILKLIEDLMKKLWREILDEDVHTPFKRLTYAEAMSRFGSDKPDTRFALELIDVTEIVRHSDFTVFKSIIEKGGKVNCINAKKCSSFSRGDIEELETVVKTYGAKGLAWMKMADKLESNIVKFFSDSVQNELIKEAKIEKDDLLLFVADHKHFNSDTIAGQLRLHLGKKLKLIDESKWDFLWVIDFPLVEFDEDEQRHVAVHHPFTSPKDEDIALLESHPEKARAKAYDIVLNGTEIGGGSIRIHKQELQKRMFNVLGISEEQANKKFGFLLEAFRYGAPPHGGIALGIDRISAMMTRNDSIREVIAFPKNKAAASIMDDAPNEVDEKQLKELHIKLDIVKKEEKKQ